MLGALGNRRRRNTLSAHFRPIFPYKRRYRTFRSRPTSLRSRPQPEPHAPPTPPSRIPPLPKPPATIHAPFAPPLPSLAVPTSCQEERSGGAAGGAVNWGSLRRICSAGTGPRSEEEEERPSRGRGRVGWGVLDVPPGGLLNWAWAGGGGALEGALWRLRRPVLGGAPAEGCLKPVGC